MFKIPSTASFSLLFSSSFSLARLATSLVRVRLASSSCAQQEVNYENCLPLPPAVQPDHWNLFLFPLCLYKACSWAAFTPLHILCVYLRDAMKACLRGRFSSPNRWWCPFHWALGDGGPSFPSVPAPSLFSPSLGLSTAPQRWSVPAALSLPLSEWSQAEPPMSPWKSRKDFWIVSFIGANGLTATSLFCLSFGHVSENSYWILTLVFKVD